MFYLFNWLLWKHVPVLYFTKWQFDCQVHFIASCLLNQQWSNATSFQTDDVCCHHRKVRKANKEFWVVLWRHSKFWHVEHSHRHLGSWVIRDFINCICLISQTSCIRLCVAAWNDSHHTLVTAKQLLVIERIFRILRLCSKGNGCVPLYSDLLESPLALRSGLLMCWSFVIVSVFLQRGGGERGDRGMGRVVAWCSWGGRQRQEGRWMHHQALAIVVVSMLTLLRGPISCLCVSGPPCPVPLPLGFARGIAA